METARGILKVLRLLSEGAVDRRGIEEVLAEDDIYRNERTVRRWLQVLREEGFEVEKNGRRYELKNAPVRLAFDNYEALATLCVLDSLAEREQVYGDYFGSAAAKLREAIPEEALKFADGGRIEFALESAGGPPEDPLTIDVLRRAARRSQKVEMLYHSLSSDSTLQRTVEPVRVSYTQRAHRLYAYEREANRVTEFRVNRIMKAKMLPDKFSPEAHTRSFATARVRLSEKAFIAYGKSVIPDPDALVEKLGDGGAVITGNTPSVFWTVRDLASLGPDAEVLGGPELRDEFQSFLQETLEKYE